MVSPIATQVPRSMITQSQKKKSKAGGSPGRQGVLKCTQKKFGAARLFLPAGSVCIVSRREANLHASAHSAGGCAWDWNCRKGASTCSNFLRALAQTFLRTDMDVHRSCPRAPISFLRAFK